MSKQRTVAEDIAAMRDKLEMLERAARPETNPFIDSDNDEQATEAYGLEYIPKAAAAVPKWLEKGAELFGKAKPKAVIPKPVAPKVTPPGTIRTAKPGNPNIAAEVPATKAGALSPEQAAKIKAAHGDVGVATAQRRVADDAARQAASKTATTGEISAAMKPGAGLADDAGKAAAAELKAAQAGGRATFLKWIKANPGKLGLATMALGLPAGYFLSGDSGQGAQDATSGGPGAGGAGAGGSGSGGGEDDSALIAEITALYKELSATGVTDIVTALVPIKDKFEGAGGKFAADAVAPK